MGLGDLVVTFNQLSHKNNYSSVTHLLLCYTDSVMKTKTILATTLVSTLQNKRSTHVVAFWVCCVTILTQTRKQYSGGVLVNIGT